MHENHDGHRERLRNRICKDGLEQLFSHEALEFLLFHCLPRQDVNVLAHRLLDRFGSLRGVFQAREEDFAGIEGMGEGAVRFLCDYARLLWEYDVSSLDEDAPVLINYHQVCDYMDDFFANRATIAGQTWQLCLGKDHELLHTAFLCTAFDWSRPQVMEKAMRCVLESHAANVVLVEVDGILPRRAEYPRMAGVEMYARALRAMGVSLLDIILLGKEARSLRYDGDFSQSTLLQSMSAALREDYLADNPADYMADAAENYPDDSAEDDPADDISDYLTDDLHTFRPDGPDLE